MKQLASLIILMCVSLQAHADIFAVFREADGSTNWQYVANTSASLLIIILSVVLVFLIRANLRAHRSNRALTEIKATLEDRVAERTRDLRETTEQLREREAYITSIVNSMPVMLIGLNDQLKVTQWNKTAEDITGRPFGDVAGKNLWVAYPAITLTEDQVQSVLTTGETLHLKHTQRGQYSFDITLYRLRDHHDTGIVILISDITKQVKAETKVAERDKISALGELASAMAYDISLPINTIFQHVSDARQRIEGTDLGPVQDLLLQEVDVVRRSAQQATAIAQNLLDLSRSYRSKKQLADIPALMDRSIELAKGLFTDTDGLTFSDIEIVRNYRPALPKIYCYPDELVQVFTRMLRSAYYALKARDPAAGEPLRITIDIGEFVDSLWIKVAHRGQCLDADAQVEIFEPFFAITSDITSYPVEHRLSYPYFIITEHHRGHMSVTSDEQLGTCFNIQLSVV
ncbi:MAG: hypothetical protein RLZZ385_960 [Pseudomonadota bacterium]